MATLFPSDGVLRDMTEEVEEVAVDEPIVETPDEPDQHDEPAQAAREWTDDDAEEAKAFGWKDPDEWEGDKPPGYIDDPRRFMERAEGFTPFRKLREKLDGSTAAFDERVRKIEAMQDKSNAALKEQHQREIGRVRAAMRKAVEDGDTERYDALESHREGLERKAEPEAPQQQAPQVDPTVRAYQQANEWAKDPLLWKQAVEAVNYMPDLDRASTAEQLAYAEQRVRDLYPHKFAAPSGRAKPMQRVDGGGLAGGKKSGFASLDAEAKRAFEKNVRDGLFPNNDAGRETYFKAYSEA